MQHKCVSVSCPECWGRGWIEQDDPKPMSFSRPYGYVDSIKVDCPSCGGDGFVSESEGDDDE